MFKPALICVICGQKKGVVFMETLKKLQILSEDSQYDLACACGTSKDDRRHRGGDGKWLYPVTLPQGGHSVLFKTLLSNV